MRLIFIGLFISLGMLTLNAHAREIQKWVDKDGQIHYGDYTEEYKSQTLNVTDAPVGARSSAPSLTERNKTRDKLLKSMQDSRKSKKEAAEKADKKAAELATLCKSAKRSLAINQQGARLVTFDDNGERHYLDDKERAQNIAEANKQIAKYCK